MNHERIVLVAMIIIACLAVVGVYGLWGLVRALLLGPRPALSVSALALGAGGCAFLGSLAVIFGVRGIHEMQALTAQGWTAADLEGWAVFAGLALATGSLAGLAIGRGWR